MGENDFELVLFDKHPELAIWKEKLLSCSADSAGISGSGSSLFGVFQSREHALEAQAQFVREPLRTEVVETWNPSLSRSR